MHYLVTKTGPRSAVRWSIHLNTAKRPWVGDVSTKRAAVSIAKQLAGPQGSVVLEYASGLYPA